MSVLKRSTQIAGIEGHIWMLLVLDRSARRKKRPRVAEKSIGGIYVGLNIQRIVEAKSMMGGRMFL